MLHEGNVVASLELVDNVSISVSKNFVIHIIKDPNDGTSFIESDDYTVFQQATLAMNNLAINVENGFETIKDEFNGMKEEFTEIKDITSMTQDMIDDLSDKYNELNNRHDFDLTFYEF